MSVINLDDHRPVKTGPCTVTFYSQLFSMAKGQNGGISFSITVENGDYASVIDLAKHEGGFWSDGGEGARFFVPWPFAAILVTAA